MTARTRISDPLVPLDPERLKEARKEVGLTVNALAKKAGVRQQTLDAMLHPQEGGKKKQCRRSHRDRLAKALKLPEFESNGSRWLGGEVRDLYASVTVYEDGGRIVHYMPRPAAIDLARMRLLERCQEAWARDQAKPADSNVPPRPASIAKDARFVLLKGALQQLTNCVWWRNRILATDPFPPTRAEHEAQLQTLPEDRRREVMEAMEDSEGRDLFWDEMSREERENWLRYHADPAPPGLSAELADRIERAFIEAFEALLEPWFAGDADLLYKELLALRGARPVSGAQG